MTQEQFNQNYGRIAMPKPFAHDGLITPIVDIGDSTHPVNFADGFPSEYSAPHSKGGKYVTRGEFNAIGNLATRNDFYKACGGLNTFNAALASKIGGYPKGAVLDHVINGSAVRRIMSYVDNNLVNPSSGGIGSNGWIFCDIEQPAILDTVFRMNVYNATGVLGIFKSESDVDNVAVGPGFVVTELRDLSTKINIEQYSASSPAKMHTYLTGYAILIKDLGTTPSTSVVDLPSFSIASDNTSVTWNYNEWKSVISTLSVKACKVVGQYEFNLIDYPYSNFSSGLIGGHYYSVAIYTSQNQFESENVVEEPKDTWYWNIYSKKIDISGEVKIVK